MSVANTRASCNAIASGMPAESVAAKSEDSMVAVLYTRRGGSEMARWRDTNPADMRFTSSSAAGLVK